MKGWENLVMRELKLWSRCLVSGKRGECGEWRGLIGSII